jgi:hypothetical protein
MMAEPDYGKTRRWLLGLAEAQVTASGSRATFVSDMYFEAAEAIDTLLKQQAELVRMLTAAQCALKSYEYGNASTELAKEICAAINPVIEKAKRAGTAAE